MYLYAMPTNGMRRESWWLRGAYEDVFRLDLDRLLFPLGTNLCDSLWVYTWGMAGVRLGDTSNRIVAAGAPMSAVPQVSRFWDAPTTNRSHLLTWENFFLNRDTNTPVSAQLELMPSGDFIARSNLVERLYRRVNPDDWDDDGIQNDDDIQPLAYDGDNFGPHQIGCGGLAWNTRKPEGIRGLPENGIGHTLRDAKRNNDMEHAVRMGLRFYHVAHRLGLG